MRAKPWFQKRGHEWSFIELLKYYAKLQYICKHANTSKPLYVNMA